jgi:hypothetical protein
MMNFNTQTQTAGVIAQEPEFYTVEDLTAIMAEAKQAAHLAAQQFLADWNSKTGGCKRSRRLCSGSSVYTLWL